VLRRIFGPKRAQTTGQWRKPHNKELHYLYPSINKDKIGRTCSMYGGGGRNGVDKVLVGKLQRKRPLGRPRHRWEDNITTELQEVGWRGME
jgi:hypothetical protein